MTIAATLMLLFLFSLGLSLAFTPMVTALGIRLGAIDIPKERKVHTKPTPRIGGLAVFLAAITTIYLSSIFLTPVSKLLVFNAHAAFGLGGMLVVFGCGLWDDFRRLNPWIKLFLQILGATLAFAGGASINGFFIGSYSVKLGFLISYAVTVFWFLLFINAVNLIDGLDGLAGGVVFFTCILMVFLSYSNGAYLSAFYFSVLGGAILGFLRYNFNPATIFLGDGGSYLLGYAVAILAIQSSTKSQVGVLMLIPLLALGVPIFDTILSPIRRFIRGRSMFQPDKGHIHHVFLKMGLSSSNAVWVIYGITMALCLLAIFLITFRGKGLEGIVLALLLFGTIILVRKMGYLEYLAFDKFYGWFEDVTDVAGFSQKRRSFLSMQIAIGRSQDIDELWENVVDALVMLKFNEAQLYLEKEPAREWKMAEDNDLLKTKTSGSENKDVDGFDSLFKIEIPLKENGDILGKLILVKDLKLGELQPYTIRRVEHLRRTLIPNIKRFKK